jgi:hypothetical protein
VSPLDKDAVGDWAGTYLGTPTTGIHGWTALFSFYSPIILEWSGTHPEIPFVLFPSFLPTFTQLAYAQPRAVMIAASCNPKGDRQDAIGGLDPIREIGHP